MSNAKLKLPSSIAVSGGLVSFAGPSGIENGINLLGPRAGLRSTLARPQKHLRSDYTGVADNLSLLPVKTCSPDSQNLQS